MSSAFPFRDTLRRPTSWHVFTSSGETAAVGSIVEVGVTHGDFYLTQTPSTAQVAPGPGGGHYANVTRLRFVGAGAGVGLGPLLFDFSASATDMPSGGRIYCGPSLNGSDVKIEDLRGWCTMEAYSASALAGGSYTVLYFGVGPSGFLPSAIAIGIVKGKQVGIPGASAMQFIGRIR
jgi:hypothetical protein